MSTSTIIRPPVPPEAARDRRRAWKSLLLYPVGFVLAFVVGEGLATALGYEPGEAVSWYVPVLAGIPAVLLFVVPGLLALRYGRRAMRGGDPGGLAPVVVGATVAVAFVGINLLGFLAQVLI
ncbi:MAG TPA: hypothetical protein VFV40_08760 [Nocardioides sp.]|nr:hypothetical protein [Nocardioides sp.]